MSTPNIKIHATVTPYEGDQPGPRDWAGYVAQRLRDMAPGAEVEVSYGSLSAVTVYGDDEIDDELDGRFGDLHEKWWNELCADPHHEQWQ